MNAAPWGNRILATDMVAAGQLLANEANWRIHPLVQQDHLSASLTKVGFVQTVIVNRRSSPLWGVDAGIETMVDGHLRVSLAISRGEDTLVPVSYVDLDPDEERWVLLTFDPIGALAVADHEQVADLLARLPAEDAMLARALHEDTARTRKQAVSFEAERTYNVLVTCGNEPQQATLLSKLQDEGYTCRTA